MTTFKRVKTVNNCITVFLAFVQNSFGSYKCQIVGQNAYQLNEKNMFEEQLGKIDFESYVFGFDVHIRVNVSGQRLHRFVVALLAIEDVRQELERLVLEVVAHILQRLVGPKEAPRHQRRDLLGNGVEMAHEPIGIAEHTAFGLQHGPNGGGKRLR